MVIPEEMTYEMVMQVLPRNKRRRILRLMAENFPKPKTIVDSREMAVPISLSEEQQEVYDTLGTHLSDNFIWNIWRKARTERWVNKDEYKKKPLKEGRDNKGVKVGSGGSNRQTIRFPKKNRSAATWKKFWTLFPQCKGFYTYNEYEKDALKKHAIWMEEFHKKLQ